MLLIRLSKDATHFPQTSTAINSSPILTVFGAVTTTSNLGKTTNQGVEIRLLISQVW